MAVTEFQVTLPDEDNRPDDAVDDDERKIDPRTRIYNPLATLMDEGGLYHHRINLERLTQDPELGARIAGLKLATGTLMQVTESAEIERFTNQWVDAIRNADAFVLGDFDYPLLMAYSQGPEKVRDIRTALNSMILRLKHANPKFLYVAHYTRGVESILNDAGLVSLTGTEEGRMLEGLDEAGLGIFYGRRLQQLSIQRTWMPALLMQELYDRCTWGGLYIKPMLDSWLANNATGPSRYMPTILTDGPLIDRLVACRFLSVSRLDQPYEIHDGLSPEVHALLQVLETCALVGLRDDSDLVPADAGDRPNAEGVTDAPVEPVAIDAEDIPVEPETTDTDDAEVTNDAPDAESEPVIRPYIFASRTADRVIALLSFMMVVRPDSDWTVPAQELVAALMDVNPEGAASAVDRLTACIEPDIHEIDLAGFAHAALLCSDVDVRRDWDPVTRTDTLNMRLPGGLHQLIFAPVGFDPLEGRDPTDPTPLIVLHIGD